MRIFAAVIPSHPHAGFSGAADESNALGNHVELARSISKYSDLGFEPELDDGVQRINPGRGI